MTKTISVLTAAAVVASLATAFAQTPAPEAGPAPTPAQVRDHHCRLQRRLQRGREEEEA